MLNCKQATELMSQKMDRNLHFGMRMSLRMHLMMCSGCRNFSRQMEFLRRASRKVSQQP